MSTTTTHKTTLGAVLALVTGTLVCPLDEMYELQDFLVGRPLMTHERTVGWDRQRDALLKQFPRLAECEAPDFSTATDVRAACLAWVAEVAAHVGWTTATVQAVDGCEVDPGAAWDRMFGLLGSGDAATTPEADR